MRFLKLLLNLIKKTCLPDPFDNIMIWVVQFRLKNFQVSNFESRWSKWNFKVHWNWRPCPLLLCVSCQQLDFGRDLRFLHASHPLYFPHNRILTGLILGLTLHADELHPAGVEGCRNSNFYLLSQQRWFKVRLDNNFYFKLWSPNFAYKRNNTKWQRNILKKNLLILWVGTKWNPRG